jgi:hypothetical protein
MRYILTDIFYYTGNFCAISSALLAVAKIPALGVICTGFGIAIVCLLFVWILERVTR